MSEDKWKDTFCPGEVIRELRTELATLKSLRDELFDRLASLRQLVRDAVEIMEMNYMDKVSAFLSRPEVKAIMEEKDV